MKHETLSVVHFHGWFLSWHLPRVMDDGVTLFHVAIWQIIMRRKLNQGELRSTRFVHSTHANAWIGTSMRTKSYIPTIYIIILSPLFNKNTSSSQSRFFQRCATSKRCLRRHLLQTLPYIFPQSMKSPSDIIECIGTQLFQPWIGNFGVLSTSVKKLLDESGTYIVGCACFLLASGDGGGGSVIVA